jgi:hypothetical protein
MYDLLAGGNQFFECFFDSAKLFRRHGYLIPSISESAPWYPRGNTLTLKLFSRHFRKPPRKNFFISLQGEKSAAKLIFR